jgi:hypothetical protein
LPEILGERQLLGIVRGDPADPAADRERHLDHFVEGRTITGRTERAVVFLLVDAFERRTGVEHPATARTQHVP